MLGELSDLIGPVTISYNISGTEPEFRISVEYSVDDLNITDTGTGFLEKDAATSMRLSSTDEFLQDGDLPLACTFSAATNQFLCILDPGGEDEIFFLFDRLSSGDAEGSFEFCNGAGTITCVTNVTISPDGMAEIMVQDPQTEVSIASREFSGETDLLPYLRYLKQGSADDTLSVDLSNVQVDALVISAARDLKNLLMEE